MGLATVKEIWTINKCTKVEGDVTHTHEVAYEKLSDALNYIAIWSNMKAASGYGLAVEPTDDSNNQEMVFCAFKEKTHTYESMELEKVELKGRKEDP